MPDKKKSPAERTGQQHGTIFGLDTSSSIARTATPLQTLQPDQRTNALSTRISSAQPYDIDTLLIKLERKLPGIHKEGHSLAAPCPKCGGTRRFFAGHNVGYRVFHCRTCGHSAPTATLLGLSWAVEAAPAVKPWQPTATEPGRIAAIRELYGNLATFAAAQISHNKNAISYLAKRGLIPAQLTLTPEAADLTLVRRAGLGYLDAGLYRQWYAGLDAGQRAACEWAGLPAVHHGRLTGHGAMFAGGHQGKIVFPYFDDAGAVVDLRTRSISSKDTITSNGKSKTIRYTSPRGAVTDRGVDLPYGVHLLPATGPVILTEGEFKAITVTLLAGVGCLGLRGVDDWHDTYLDLLRGRLVILAFDNDKAGAGANIKIGRRLVANGIDTMILPPDLLGKHKGIDDFITAEGGATFAKLVEGDKRLTLSEYERQLEDQGVDLEKIKSVRADVGTLRQWRPAPFVDDRPHAEQPTVTVDEAVSEIAGAVRGHLRNWRRGHEQLLITAPAGVGKTQTTIDTALSWAAEHNQTVAVVLPNHATIDEKIADGTLAGFRHIYGHAPELCQQSSAANALIRKGYSPGEILCPSCPFAAWCHDAGYKSQFKRRENRAYVHAHLHSDYPDNEDLVIADELTHKTFVDSMRVLLGDLASTLEQGGMPAATVGLLRGLMQMWTAPGLSDVAGLAFYAVLERYFPGLRDVDAWGDGSHVQGALFDAATAYVNGAGAADDLPQQYGQKLIGLLSEDVRRLNAGQPVTGRVRFVSVSSRAKWLELTYSRGHLPAWYNRRPTIILNATADADLMADLCGPLRVVAPQVAIADGNEIIQDVTYNNAKSAYTGKGDLADARRAAWLDAIRGHITAHAGGESDTTIIVAKALAPIVEAAFPAAKVAYYHALEGRNDLQSGLTILASAVPIDTGAIQREAAALYPGIDTTLTRRAVGYEAANAGGELLTVEQIDGADYRVSALLAQHRDAAAVQAVHRSRIIRQSGRRVVVMFSRPIPGLRPSQLVTDRPTAESKQAARRAATIDKLMAVAGDLVGEMGGFAADLLAAGAAVSVNTARKYLGDICTALGLNNFVLPALQRLANGATVKREVTLVVTPGIVASIKKHVDHERNNRDKITNVIYVHLAQFLPSTWIIDIDTILATMTPSGPEPAPNSDLPKRWGAATDAGALKAELLRAKGGSPEKQQAARVLISFLNAATDDRAMARWAAYEIGIERLIEWAVISG